MQIRILSSADIRREVLRDAKSYNNVRIEHLLKLFYYRQDERDKMGWIRTVTKSPFTIDRMKGNHKFPSAKDIYHELWLVKADIFSSIEKGAFLSFEDITDYPVPSSTSSNSYKFCEDYHKWMSEYLSTNGVMVLSDVKSEIDSLLAKYPI